MAWCLPDGAASGQWSALNTGTYAGNSGGSIIVAAAGPVIITCWVPVRSCVCEVGPRLPTFYRWGNGHRVKNWASGLTLPNSGLSSWPVVYTFLTHQTHNSSCTLRKHLSHMHKELEWLTPVFFHWRILGTEEPGGLWSLGLQRVGHDRVTKTHTHTGET